MFLNNDVRQNLPIFILLIFASFALIDAKSGMADGIEAEPEPQMVRTLSPVFIKRETPYSWVPDFARRILENDDLRPMPSLTVSSPPLTVIPKTPQVAAPGKDNMVTPDLSPVILANPESGPLVVSPTSVVPAAPPSTIEVPSSGLSAALSISISNSPALTVISLKGEIAQGDDIRFIDAALKATGSTVVVEMNSPGGNLVAGIRIGDAIRLKGFRTYVRTGSVCASACAAAWLAGSPRILADGAAVGFHAAFNDDSSKTVTAEGNALFGAYLNRLSISESAILYMTHAPPSGMQWLTPDDADQIGLAVMEAACAACTVTSR